MVIALQTMLMNAHVRYQNGYIEFCGEGLVCEPNVVHLSVKKQVCKRAGILSWHGELVLVPIW